MVLEKEPKLMANSKLLKTIGLYQILNSSSPHPKVYGYNSFKCIAVIEIFIATATIISCILNAFYCLNDINEATRYFSIGVMCAIIAFKFCYIIGYSDTIWNCLRITSIEYLTYKYHSRRMLEVGRKRSKFFLILFIVLWIAVYLNWMLIPIVVQNSYVRVEAEHLIYHYRTNIMSLVYPVTDKFYNENFIMFYSIECIVMIVGIHSTFMFDTLLISTCITITCYLKTIANSFSTLGNVENHFMTRYDETKILNDFKIIIQDQQKVIENMKNIYKVIRPVILFQIAAGSSVIILLSIITIMNYFNGFSLASPMNLNLLSTILTFTLEIYFICYLLNGVNEQKDSLNFALYSSDWLDKSLKYKKKILCAMRMNNANQLKLQVTLTRIVNLELFTGVMRTTYSVISVLSDQLAKQT
nr:odorant receptor 29 [Myzus persicae]